MSFDSMQLKKRYVVNNDKSNNAKRIKILYNY